jgi:hypothetical protein
MVRRLHNHLIRLLVLSQRRITPETLDPQILLLSFLLSSPPLVLERLKGEVCEASEGGVKGLRGVDEEGDEVGVEVGEGGAD